MYAYVGVDILRAILMSINRELGTTSLHHTCKKRRSVHAYNIITAALITVVHKPSLCPSADCVKLCVL